MLALSLAHYKAVYARGQHYTDKKNRNNIIHLKSGKKNKQANELIYSLKLCLEQFRSGVWSRYNTLHTGEDQPSLT